MTIPINFVIFFSAQSLQFFRILFISLNITIISNSYLVDLATTFDFNIFLHFSISCFFKFFIYNHHIYNKYNNYNNEKQGNN